MFLFPYLHVKFPSLEKNIVYVYFDYLKDYA